MYDYDFQYYLSLGILPFIQQKMPFGHRFFMDNDPKHTSGWTREFLILISMFWNLKCIGLDANGDGLGWS